MTKPSSKPRILIVDDALTNLKMLITMLEGDYDITVATDGAIALQAVKAASQKPDLILLDIEMPIVDGYKVCVKLKVNPNTKEIPIIFLTAKDDDDDEAKGLTLGAVDYITKPFNPVVVKARINMHLDMQRHRSAVIELNRKNEILLQSIGEGVCGLDMEGRITFINLAGLEMTGWKAEELIGKIQHDVMHHTYADGRKCPREECPVYGFVGTGQKIYRNDGIFWRKDGTFFPVEYVCNPIVDGGGKESTSGVVIVFKDITERKQANLEREKNIDYGDVIRSLLELSMLPLSLKDLIKTALELILSAPYHNWNIEDTGVISFIDEKTGYLEFLAHNNVPESIIECVSHVPQDCCLCGRKLKLKELTLCDHTDILHDNCSPGVEFHSHFVIPIMTPNNVLLGVLTLYMKENFRPYPEEIEFFNVVSRTLANMIEFKLVELKLRENEQKFSSLAYSTKDGIVMVGEDGKINFWSRAAEMMFGFAEQEIIGQNLHDHIISSASDSDLFIKDFEMDSQEHDTIIGKTKELIGRRKSGQGFPIEISFSGVRQNGQWQVIAVIRDITQRKRHEEREKFTSFQAGVAEMSISVLHNIGNAIMSITNRADEVNKGSKELEGMAGIFSQIGVLAKKKMEKGQSERETLDQLVNIIEETGGDIQAIIDDKFSENANKIMDGVQHISEIIKIQQNAGQSPTYRSIFNLDQLIDDAIVLQQDNLEKCGIMINVQVGKDFSEINLPRSQFLQMVVNLIKNSSEAIGMRGEKNVPLENGMITITCLLLDDHSLDFRIKDNGCGISENKLIDIFRYGYTTKHRGTGFGLHSVSTFVQSLKGSIEALSQGKDKGCELVIQIPLVLE